MDETARFIRHLQRATTIVESWPEWKRNVLGALKPESSMSPTVERTGKVFGMASSEYRVTYPDGHVGTVWSPPWHELDDEQEDAAALDFARSLWRDGTHKNQGAPDAGAQE
jgi:hypothetical protein